MGPVGAGRHIRCAQLPPQNPFASAWMSSAVKGWRRMLLAHQINKAIQYGGVAVYRIANPDGIGVIVGDGLGPFLIAGRVARVRVLSWTVLARTSMTRSMP